MTLLAIGREEEEEVIVVAFGVGAAEEDDFDDAVDFAETPEEG